MSWSFSLSQKKNKLFSKPRSERRANIKQPQNNQETEAWSYSTSCLVTNLLRAGRRWGAPLCQKSFPEQKQRRSLLEGARARNKKTYATAHLDLPPATQAGPYMSHLWRWTRWPSPTWLPAQHTVGAASDTVRRIGKPSWQRRKVVPLPGPLTASASWLFSWHAWPGAPLHLRVRWNHCCSPGSIFNC